jgi:hypothetical protein
MAAFVAWQAFLQVVLELSQVIVCNTGTQRLAFSL